jgi:hypothetical protein
MVFLSLEDYCLDVNQALTKQLGVMTLSPPGENRRGSARFVPDTTASYSARHSSIRAMIVSQRDVEWPIEGLPSLLSGL